MKMGSKCPKCGKLTLWKTPTGVKCSNADCGYSATIPANNGKGGKGKLCPVCKKRFRLKDYQIHLIDYINHERNNTSRRKNT